MQTFLPYPSFAESAKCLDDKRLLNQRNEALVILKQNCGCYERGWPNHPAVLMWKGHEASLAMYALTVCQQSLLRGFDAPMWADVMDIVIGKSVPIERYDDWPWWLGIEEFHASHRSNLLRKDPAWYNQFDWTEGPDLPYWWPTHHGDMKP